MNVRGSSWYREKVLPGLQGFLEHSRWYSGKGRDISEIQLLDYGMLDSQPVVIVAVVRVFFKKDDSETYLIPQMAGNGQGEGIVDGVDSAAYISAVMGAMFKGKDIKLENGNMHGIAEGRQEIPVNEHTSIRPLIGEQSNTSLNIDSRWVYKTFRKLNSGENPDFSVCSYLYRKCHFQWVPETLGKLTLETGGSTYDVGILTRYVNNAGDGWKVTTAALKEIMQQFSSGKEDRASFLVGQLSKRLERLGQITAMMHNCLSSNSTDKDFMPEPVSGGDIKLWADGYHSLVEETFETIGSFIEKYPENASQPAIEVLGKKNLFLGLKEPLNEITGNGLYKIRIHGDYHLGQTLASGNDFYVIDFEGEPMRPLSYRTRKFMPLKDAGGMARSIEYAVDVSTCLITGDSNGKAFSGLLKQNLVDAFISSYYGSYAPVKPYLPESPGIRRELLDFFVAEKALYEVGYEVRNRPDYAWIPLLALQDLSAREHGRQN